MDSLSLSLSLVAYLIYEPFKRIHYLKLKHSAIMLRQARTFSTATGRVADPNHVRILYLQRLKPYPVSRIENSLYTCL